MTFESDAHGEGGAVINFRRQLHFTYIALHLSTDAFDLIENSKMFLGATGASYRKTCEWLNRLRRQEGEGTPLNTLRDATEAEGKRVLDFWAVKTDTVLDARGVDDDHPPTIELCENPKQIAKRSQASSVAVRKALVAAEIPEELQEEVTSNPVPYECPKQSVNICSDGVLTKKQREKRRRPGIPAESTGSDDKTTKRLNHKTATIEYDGKRYALVAATYVSLFRTILAFVLNNGFQHLRLCFFTDGERSLKNALVEAFSWHPARPSPKRDRRRLGSRAGVGSAVPGGAPARLRRGSAGDESRDGWPSVRQTPAQGRGQNSSAPSGRQLGRSCCKGRDVASGGGLPRGVYGRMSSLAT
jgi:hypothetical protein